MRDLLSCCLALLVLLVSGPALASDSPDPGDGLWNIEPLVNGEPVEGWISEAGDEDLFSFRHISVAPLLIELTSLPADYDLSVSFIDGAGFTWGVDRSVNPGTEDERIVIDQGPAYYVVRVFSARGEFDPEHPYTLLAESRGEPVPTLRSSWGEVKRRFRR